MSEIHPYCGGLHVLSSDLDKMNDDFNSLRAKLKMAEDSLEELNKKLSEGHKGIPIARARNRALDIIKITLSKLREDRKRL